MMAKFSIGEVALVLASPTHHPAYRYLIGSEVEIISSVVSDFHPNCYPGAAYYHVRDQNGIRCYCQEKFLRKKPPKEDARKWFDEKIKLKPKVLEEA